MTTGHLWSPCRNAQTAMSGTLTASTAGVRMLGGPSHPREPGRGLQPHLQELLCLLPSSAWPRPALVLRGPAWLGVEKPSRPLPLRETQDTLPAPPPAPSGV